MVCKEKYNKNIYKYVISFILTMWYVNLNDAAKGAKDTADFILTKWYVKAGINATTVEEKKILY
ncbi:hypothetical protein KLM55_04395 [Clostridioides difficile]|uniref:hypothetical protein n=1 Tax=Clostridioides difficile TaxID=1496 RepID=UPI00042232FA|nr:hypothetical protein [Clostridioides difficile]MCP3276506.1 hypothetical protein [Clostridioides difficile]MDN9901966.1 hypothetical protein [Clostridioides difficile]OMK13404.1 hypothetical protein BER27_002105 [Clostridioides difficile]HAU4870712.1 hypothetical protein [Clostridioides difficile]HBE8458030.1 hypothetical protein [Clostridioides difficile]